MAAKRSVYDVNETHYDLPSPYIPHHPTGLLHLPRFIAKIKKHLAGELLGAYQRNFTRGFDGFLCAHLGIDPDTLIDLVRKHGDDQVAIDQELLPLLPDPLNVHVWNRKVSQMGMSPMGQEALERDKQALGCGERVDVICYADLIEFDEKRLT